MTFVRKFTVLINRLVIVLPNTPYFDLECIKNCGARAFLFQENLFRMFTEQILFLRYSLSVERVLN